jgi:hypothetical protein
MEIEFNPSQLAPAASSGPVTRSATSAGGADGASLDTSGTLKDKLNALPLNRPDKVSAAQVLVARRHYPPDDLVDRIATLLAIRLGQ